MSDALDDEIQTALGIWRTARSARQAARGDRHAWANAEMAVQFWAGEFREARARKRVQARRPAAASIESGVAAALREVTLTGKGKGAETRR